MSDGPRRIARRRNLAILLSVIALAGVAVFGVNGGVLQCGGLQCGAPSGPVIQVASAQVDSFAASNCQTTTDIATCRVYLSGGDRGTVSLNVTVPNLGGGQGAPQVEFLVYSSAASYVSFTSIPVCSHTSAPSYQDQGCEVTSNATETFRFSFVVSQNYGDATARWPDSISVVMWTF
jgi:hypothetical protein